MEVNFPDIEKKILKFWKENKIFEKLRKKNQGKKRWSFLDGPITANNPMGVHHAWGRTYKDLFQRYNAMRGHDERFQNGFDCQGLWVEVEVEKELGFKTKKDIEAYGIGAFVEKCKERVLKYSKIQTGQSIRLGQWMDWENSYYTMSEENNYAIWGFLKKCKLDGNLYKGRDSVPWCPRCGTAISQHEILTEDYKGITHDSLYLEYPIVGRKNEFLLVWTTTPWTLPGNVAIAVDPKKEYALASGSAAGNKYYILKDLAASLGLKILYTVAGEKLVGLQYQSPFDHLLRIKKSFGNYTHRVIPADPQILPISDTEGTGLVHIAPGAGSEDFKLGGRMGIPVIELIGEEANYLDELDEFSGKNAKNNPAIVIDYLKSTDNGKYLFDIKTITHRYPICWRCKEELVWRVVDEWYIAMDPTNTSKAKDYRSRIVEVARKIEWIPSFGLDRELDWLDNMQDWLISKKRYWGLALPIFECKKCGNFEVIGSKEELKEKAIVGWEKFEGHSPHRPWVDEVKIKCPKCEEPVSRIPDVGNPWLDAGIVSFSTMDESWFPADFICESFPGQFKNWFYSLIVMSTVLKNTHPTKTIFGYASVHDEKDEEMHKSKGNAIWFDDAVEKIGADPMRWMYARQNPVENLKFGYNNAGEVKRKLLTLCNVIEFFTTYASREQYPAKEEAYKSKNLLDRWILSRLHNVTARVSDNFDEYNAAQATLAVEDFFINDLSLWYVRRSRRRFQRPQSSEEMREAVRILWGILVSVLKLIAPIMPFFAEENYGKLRSKEMPESVHLLDWPTAQEEYIDERLEKQMQSVREIVAMCLAERASAKIKVRQPLASLKMRNEQLRTNEELLDLVKDEVNVKKIVFDKNLKSDVELDTQLTPALKEEGQVREILRSIQEMRKEAGYKPGEKAVLYYEGKGELADILEVHQDLIAKGSSIQKFVAGKVLNLDKEKQVSIGNFSLWLGITKT